MPKLDEVDFNESDPRQQAPSSTQFKDLAIGTGCLLLVGLAIWLGVYAFGLMKDAGWITQSRVMDVYVTGDWPAGELRSCQTVPHPDALFCLGPGESQTASAASKQSPGQFPVRFSGIATEKPGDSLNWSCKRDADSIRCNAVR